MATSKKPKAKVIKLKDFRSEILQKVKCTMKDCGYKAELSFRADKKVEQLHCPECVNQSLEKQ